MGRKTAFRHPRYRVVRLLAEGGMGKVYLARDLLEGGQEVALKVYPARYHHERLREEFLALKELHHPGVARAFHFGVSDVDAAPFFTLEHIRGEPLDRHAASLPVKSRAVSTLRLLLQAAAAVAYLHRRGVLHLDLKPENILVVEGARGIAPRPVLIDFGLVRAVKSPPKLLGHATLPYAPPEALSGDPPSPASDVYSLAAAFYRAISGRLPVKGSDFASFARAHRSGAAEPLPEAPPPVERVLLRALTKDPQRRFRDAGELHRALVQAAAPALEATRDAAARAVSFHEPDFVGRAAEVQAFLRWLDGRRADRPLFEVRGGNGWGKTRFLEKVQTLLETRGKTVLFLRAADGRGRGILHAADEAAAILSPRPRGRVNTARSAANPESRNPPAVAEETTILRRRVLRRILPLLRADTFLVIDDLHAASPAEQALVDDAAHALRMDETARGGIIVSRGIDADARRSQGAPCGEDIAVQVDLGPLALDEALEVDLEGLDGALARLSPERARALKTKLHHQAGGHPLFFVRGLLDLAGDPEEAVRLAPTERILAQVAQLEPAERSAAACIAAFARPVEVEEAAGALGIDAVAAAAAVVQLRSIGLLATSGSAVRMIHKSAAEAVIESLPRSDVSAMHAGIAASLEKSRRGELLAEASWHFFEAGDPQRGLAAAEAWLERGKTIPGAAGAQTVETLQRAAKAAGATSRRGRRLVEAASDVLEALGRFEECAAERARLVEGSKGSRRGAGDDEDDDEDTVRRRRKLGAVYHREGRLEPALEHLAACVTPSAAKAAPVESLRARSDLALLHHFRGETDLALEHATRGVESWTRSTAAERSATIQSAVNFHAVLGQVHIRRLELDDATRVLKKGLELARKTRSPSNTALLLNNLALAHHLSGRLETALATFEQAEAIAKDLEDPAALVSIRSNVAQIHARKGRFLTARAVLDEIEESPAVAQSKRLRLNCFYTRGLILSLLGADSHELWRRVEAMAGEADDTFLARFARVYQVESLLSAGLFSAARAILGGDPNPKLEAPVFEAPRLARLALIEALTGRVDSSRDVRRKLARAATGPPLLEAWNDLYSGLAALETGDVEDALRDLEGARRVFHETGFAVGEIECALVLADAHLRLAARKPEAAAAKSLLAAEREIERAREVSVEAPRDVSPRSRDLRGALLEARLVIERLSRLHRDSARRRSSASVSTAREQDLRAALRDLLSKAAGDPALASSVSQRILLECLRSASARLDGDLELARSAAAQARIRHEEAASLLDSEDRASFLAVEPWDRLRLDRFRPATGEPILEARHAAALATVLRVAETSDGPSPLAIALEAIGRVTGAKSVELQGDSTIVSSWKLPAVARPRAAVAKRDLQISERVAIASRLSFHGETVGWIRLAAGPHGGFRACDEAFLEAAALAIAPHVAARSPRETAPSAAQHSEERTAAIEKTAGKAAHAVRKGSPAKTTLLERTHRLLVSSSKNETISRIFRSEGVVATGREMLKVMRACAALAATDLPILVSGDSGTGKSLVAQIIHRLSARSAGPFVAQSASAVPPELFEADFFGYERGAFTGAERTRTGFLFQAAGGTFHLEEVGDLDLALQQRLLRVIEERVVRPLGATSERRLDVRFIASTQRDLEAMVRRGEFRKDLYYRLSGARIHLPPLAERKDDLTGLIEHHWRELTGSTARFPPAALEMMRSHDWPGNVRELVSVLRRLSLETAGSPGTSDVRAALGQHEPRGLFPSSVFESRSFDDVARKLEESYLEHLFEKHAGNLEAIAAALGTTTRSIYRRFERLGLKPKDLKGQR